jgi:hypothetical protein
MGVLSSLLMAKQHFHTYDSLGAAMDGIQAHSDKGQTVQSMCAIGGEIVVVFNNEQHQHARDLVLRSPSQFADKSSDF